MLTIAEDEVVYKIAPEVKAPETGTEDSSDTAVPEPPLVSSTVRDQYSTKRRKYGNTDPFSVFLSTLTSTVGVMRIN